MSHLEKILAALLLILSLALVAEAVPNFPSMIQLEPWTGRVPRCNESRAGTLLVIKPYYDTVEGLRGVEPSALIFCTGEEWVVAAP